MKEQLEIKKLLDIKQNKDNVHHNAHGQKQIVPAYFGQSIGDVLTIEDDLGDYLTSNNNPPHSYNKNDPDIDMSSEMFLEQASEVMSPQSAETLEGEATMSSQPQTTSPAKPFSFEGRPPTISSPITLSSAMGNTTKNATEKKNELQPEMLLQYYLPISLLKDVSHTGNPETSLNAIYLNHFWQTLQKNKAHLKDEEKAALVDLFKTVELYRNEEAKASLKPSK